MQPDMSWVGVLEHHAVRTPRQAARGLRRRDRHLRRDGCDWAAALAAGLHDRGVGAGDVVGLLSYNCIEFLETIFAANYLGAIAMPINWRLAAPELRFILDHSEARALVCDDVARRPRRTKRPRTWSASSLRVCVVRAGTPTAGRRSPISAPPRPGADACPWPATTSTG